MDTFGGSVIILLTIREDMPDLPTRNSEHNFQRKWEFRKEDNDLLVAKSGKSPQLMGRSFQMKELLSGHNHSNLQSKVTVKSLMIYILSMSQDHCYDYRHLNIVLTGSTSESGLVLTYKIPRGLF